MRTNPAPVGGLSLADSAADAGAETKTRVDAGKSVLPTTPAPTAHPALSGSQARNRGLL